MLKNMAPRILPWRSLNDGRYAKGLFVPLIDTLLGKIVIVSMICAEPPESVATSVTFTRLTTQPLPVDNPNRRMTVCISIIIII